MLIGISALVFAGGAVFYSCDGPLNADKASVTPAERRAPDAKYNDGDYTFYFKNGKNVHGDCDGYSLDFGGKTTIYEYYQSEINKWVKRLLAAGIKPEMYRTSKTGKYCWARFDTELLHGVGLVEDSRQLWGSDVFLSVNGTQIKIKNLKHVQYASPREGFKVN
jgi:hypothetical protein